jgi:RNA polymerase sigma factor (sigma-70 family)
VGFSPKGNTTPGLTLEEDVVQCAINTVQESMSETVQVINMIDKAMVALKNDPYYRILEMTYFEGRTQEDIALHYGVSQVTISKNKNKLVRELSIRLFPNQAILEML